MSSQPTNSQRFERSDAVKSASAFAVLDDTVQAFFDEWPQLGTDEPIDGGDFVEFVAEWATAKLRPALDALRDCLSGRTPT